MLTYKLMKSIFVLFYFCFGSVQAADITMSYRDSDKDAKQIIYLTGTIYKEDVKRFTKVLLKRGNRNVYVVLKLNGGHFYAALEMANQINKINKNGGNIETSAIYCHSACFFIAAAGKKNGYCIQKMFLECIIPIIKTERF